MSKVPALLILTAAGTAFLVGGCVPGESKPAAQQRPPAQQSLDSLASWRYAMSGEFYHGLRAFVFRPDEPGPLAVGTRALAILSAGQAKTVDTAGDAAALTVAPNGSHVGRMRLDHDVVASFQLVALAGAPVWIHDARGHHYYQIGPDARLVVGLSSNIAHPGKPGSVGTFVFYDRRGIETGRFGCSLPGAAEIAPDGAAVLIECRDSALVLLDSRARVLASLTGSFRNARTAAGGRVLVAVPVGKPRSVLVGGAGGESRTIELADPVRQLAVTPDGSLVVAGAGGTIYGLRPDAAAPRWRATLEGPAPLVTSLAVSPKGLVAVGAVLDGAPAVAGAPGPRAALAALVREGQVVRTVRFEMERANAWVPSVALDPAERWLLVWDPATVWSVDLARWLGR